MDTGIWHEQQESSANLSCRSSTSEAQARITADVDSTIAQLSTSAIDDSESESRAGHVIPEHELTFRAAANSPVQMSEASKPARLTADVDQTPAELSSFTQLEAPQRAQLMAGSDAFPAQSAEPPAHSDDLHMATAEHDSAQSVRLTEDIDDALADLSSSAVSSSAQLAADEPAEQSVMQSTEGPAVVGLRKVDIESESAQPGCLTEDVDAVLADLSSSADQQVPQDHSHAASGGSTAAEPNYWLAVGLHMPSTGADGAAHPVRVTEDVDAALAELSSSATQHVKEEKQAESDSQPTRVTSDVDDAVADLMSSAAAESAQQEQSQLEDSEFPQLNTMQVQDTTADVDLTVAELSATAVDHAARQQQQQQQQQQSDVAMHVVINSADQRPARLAAYVDEALRELSDSAATSIGRAQSQEAIVLESGPPARITADVDQALQELSSVAVSHAAEAQQQPPVQHETAQSMMGLTADADDMLDDVASSAAVAAKGELDTAQRVHVTAEVDAMLEDLSAFAISHAAQRPQHAPAAPSEEAADAAAVAADESYAADPIGAKEAVPLAAHDSAREAAEAAASVDVLLGDAYKADEFEAGEEADSSAAAAATAEEAEAGMPDRPASPVAMQLAMLSPMEEVTAVDMLSDRTAPASLAGDQLGRPQSCFSYLANRALCCRELYVWPAHTAQAAVMLSNHKV